MMKVKRQRVPPFFNGTALLHKKVDFCTEAGAAVLCRVIAAAWQDVGYDGVSAEPVRIPLHPGGHDHCVWGVKINGLVNGAPK